MAEIWPPEQPSLTTIRLPVPVPLADQELLDKAFAASNGADSRRCGGARSSGYDSPSEADLALCNHLAWWTGGDPARIDSMFRQSGLMREKWERQDYRDKTIGKALEGRTEYYAPGGVPSATAPRGVGTLAPPAETPVNTGDSGCQLVAPRGTPGTLRVLDVERMLTTDRRPSRGWSSRCWPRAA